MELEEIKTALEEYKEMLTSLPPEEVQGVDTAKWRLEINQLLTALNKIRYEIPTTDFYGLKNLATDLIYLCNEMSKDGMLYYRTIRNVCKEKFSVDEWVKICAEVRKRLNK